MTEREYTWGLLRLDRHGVRCPAPGDLVRGGIIGTVTVTGVVTESDSEWFGGQAGLTLEDAAIVAPIPAKGALGYFRWTRATDFAPPLPWIDRIGSAAQGGLFEDLPPGFNGVPEKPFGGKRDRSGAGCTGTTGPKTAPECWSARLDLNISSKDTET